MQGLNYQTNIISKKFDVCINRNKNGFLNIRYFTDNFFRICAYKFVKSITLLNYRDYFFLLKHMKKKNLPGINEIEQVSRFPVSARSHTAWKLAAILQYLYNVVMLLRASMLYEIWFIRVNTFNIISTIIISPNTVSSCVWYLYKKSVCYNVYWRNENTELYISTTILKTHSFDTILESNFPFSFPTLSIFCNIFK